MRNRNATWAVGISGILATIFLGLASCGKAPTNGLKTIPVQGRVTFTKGGVVKTLYDRQGIIVFDSVEQPGMRAIGEIQEDGSFTVSTVKDGVSTSGAVEGTHRVRLDLDDSATRFVAPQFLDFQKSGITVKVPSDQPIEIKVWR
jgi:hypothetical protein